MGSEMAVWQRFIDQLYAAEAGGTETEEGVAHHGPRILTRRDLAVAHCVVRWISTVRQQEGWYGPNWLPTGADFEKSRLFWRIRSGKDPLPHRPPTAYSCPWYELIDEPDRAHWAYDMSLHNGAAYIAQCAYEVLERDENSEPSRVRFGPWEFKTWKGPSPYNGTHGGWWIQVAPPREGSSPEGRASEGPRGEAQEPGPERTRPESTAQAEALTDAPRELTKRESDVLHRALMKSVKRVEPVALTDAERLDAQVVAWAKTIIDAPIEALREIDAETIAALSARLAQLSAIDASIRAGKGGE